MYVNEKTNASHAPPAVRRLTIVSNRFCIVSAIFSSNIVLHYIQWNKHLSLFLFDFSNQLTPCIGALQFIFGQFP